MSSDPHVPDYHRYWPLAGLRVLAGELELRLPGSADLAALAALAEAGVHDPQVQPFAAAWTDAEPAARARAVLQYQWSQLGAWTPEKWELNLVVALDGAIVGTQGLGARDFAVLREIGTGSWLGRQYQGQGIGTVMRAAVLTLVFDGLGAEFAVSEAFADNAASLGVSRRLGYREDGIERLAIRGRPVESRRLRLDRATWRDGAEARAALTGEIVIEGLGPCLPMFGIS